MNIMQIQYRESCEIVPGSDTLYKRQVIRILMYSCWKECYDEYLLLILCLYYFNTVQQLKIVLMRITKLIS